MIYPRKLIIVFLALIAGCTSLDKSKPIAPPPTGPQGIVIDTPHKKAIGKLVPTPDGQKLISVGTAGQIVNWEIAKNRLSVESVNHPEWSGGWGTTITDTGTKAFIYKRLDWSLFQLYPFLKISNGMAATRINNNFHQSFLFTANISPDGNFVFTNTIKGLKVYSLPRFDVVLEIDKPQRINSFIPDGEVYWLEGKVIFSLSSYRSTKSGVRRIVSQIYIWNTTDNNIKYIKKLGRENEHFTRSGFALVTFNSDGLLSVYNLTDNEITKQFSLPYVVAISNISILTAHITTGKLAIGLSNGDVVIVDIKTGHEEYLLPGNGLWQSSLVFSHDGKTIYGGLPDGKIIIWEIPSIES